MEQLIDRAEEIVKKYEKELFEKGIKCDVSRKYVESTVGDVDRSYKDYVNNPKYERLKNVKNKYYVIVLTVSPTKKGEVKKEDLKVTVKFVDFESGEVIETVEVLANN